MASANIDQQAPTASPADAVSPGEVPRYLAAIALRDNAHFWKLKDLVLTYWAEDHLVIPAQAASSSPSSAQPSSSSGPSSSSLAVPLSPSLPNTPMKIPPDVLSSAPAAQRSRSKRSNERNLSGDEPGNGSSSSSKLLTPARAAKASGLSLPVIKPFSKNSKNSVAVERTSSNGGEPGMRSKESKGALTFRGDRVRPPRLRHLPERFFSFYVVFLLFQLEE